MARATLDQQAFYAQEMTRPCTAARQWIGDRDRRSYPYGARTEPRNSATFQRFSMPMKSGAGFLGTHSGSDLASLQTKACWKGMISWSYGQKSGTQPGAIR